MKKTLSVFVAAIVFTAITTAGLAQNGFEAGNALLNLMKTDYPPSEPLLPKGAAIEAEYKKGTSKAVGLVDFVENEAYILHKETPNIAYKAAKSLPVFLDDTLVTKENSRMVVLLRDKSNFSMGAVSKCAIDKSIYNPDKGLRETAVDMAVGKARFIVRKMKDFKSDDFDVNTAVGTCGVRGSDFVVGLVPAGALPQTRTSFLDTLDFIGAAHAQETRNGLFVITRADTTVEITSTTGDSSVLGPFSGSTMTRGQAPTSAVSLPQIKTNDSFDSLAPAASVMRMPEVFQ